MGSKMDCACQQGTRYICNIVEVYLYWAICNMWLASCISFWIVILKNCLILRILPYLNSEYNITCYIFMFELLATCTCWHCYTVFSSYTFAYTSCIARWLVVMVIALEYDITHCLIWTVSCDVCNKRYCAINIQCATSYKHIMETLKWKWKWH